MEMLELVSKLEAIATQAKKMPITGQKVVDTELLLEVAQQMRLAMPRNLQEAQELLERREQIVNQTMLDARRLRATAESDARVLVNESELVRNAKARGADVIEDANRKAERIMALAEQDARQRREDADKYSQETLHKMEQQVAAVLNMIQAGQRVLVSPNLGHHSN